MMTTTTTEIRTLRAEAAAAGDTVMVDLCDLALAGDDLALRECSLAIKAARAMAD